jgi:hypothetical protein
VKVKAGDVVTFRGCRWDAGWEFDCPVVIYEPVERYSPNGDSIESMAESICDDLVCYASGELPAEVADRFSDSDMKEFAWRGWDRDGFRNRKQARHESFTVRFGVDEDGNPSFEFINSVQAAKGE